MNHELNFFIHEDLPLVRDWSLLARAKGAIVVGNNRELLFVALKQTNPGDNIKLEIAGAWLDECIFHAVRDALSPNSGDENLYHGRNIIELVVDLDHCLAFQERMNLLSPKSRRELLKQIMGSELSNDSRLHILSSF